MSYMSYVICHMTHISKGQRKGIYPFPFPFGFGVLAAIIIMAMSILWCLFTGQYSTGKSSMIRYLIRQVKFCLFATFQNIKSSFRTFQTCELDQSLQQTSTFAALPNLFIFLKNWFPYFISRFFIVVFSSFRFIIVCQGSSSAVVPGHALVMDSEKQFAPLAKFGSSFLNR